MILFMKAARTIWRSKRSYIACIVLMAVGVAMFTAFNVVVVNLQYAVDKMYGDQNFSDAFAQVRGMPLNEAMTLSGDIDGIKISDGRLSAEARVTIPGKEEKIITLRVLSYDPSEPEPMNKFMLTHGTAPGPDEILIGGPFYGANNLEVGQPLTMIINGRQVTLNVSGAALSPEYVYVIPDNGLLLPDNEAFGFAFMSYDQLATITGQQGLANMLSFRLENGYSFDDVKLQLEDALAPYGLINVYKQKDQTSASMVSQEITSISSMATSLPMMFVLMAVIILYIMLKRVIEQERGSIGTLKAFGFSDAQVLGHYLCYGLLVGGAGGVLGCLGGYAMSGFYTQMFLLYFNLPALKATINPQYMAAGMVISIVSGAFGAYMGTKGALKLNPSEAMRPPAPRVVTHDVFAKLKFLKAVLAQNGYMAVRNITRSWFRSAFVVLGVAFSFSLIGITSSMSNMIDKMMLEQFTKVELYDVKVSLKEPAALSGAEEAAYGVGGVKLAEGILAVPAEIRLDNLRENVTVTALQSGARLQKIYDSDNEFYLEPPKGGVVISASLAKKIHAVRGDTLMLKTPYTGDTEVHVPVLEVINESMGTNVYMELDSLCELLNIPKSANSILLEAADVAGIKAALQTADNVNSVTDKNEILRVYKEMLSTYSAMFVMMQLAGMGVAYAIIVNTSSISLSERKREYATLRVLGMHPREISRILGFEYWLLTAIGIIPGIPLLHGLMRGMSGMMTVDMFTMPTKIPSSSYVIAVILCFATVFICNQLASRQIAKFDMVEVLKERE